MTRNVCSDQPGCVAEASTSLLSESTSGASVVTKSNSVGQMSSVQPLPLPEPLVSSPGTKEQRKQHEGHGLQH